MSFILETDPPHATKIPENAHLCRIVIVNRSSTDEQDLRLVSALQDAPRAPWAELAPVLQMSEDTLSDRWCRLRSQGLAWISLVDQQYILERTRTFVLLRPEPGHTHELLQQLIHQPLIKTIHRISGSFSISLLLETEGRGETEWFLYHVLGNLRTIRDFEVLPAIGPITTGAAWRTAALSRTEREQLSFLNSRRNDSPDSLIRSTWVESDEVATSIVEELAEDGRRTSADLVRRLRSRHDLQTSTSTVNRKIKKVLNTPGVLIRCDISAGDMGWNCVVMLWGKISSEQAANLLSEKEKGATHAHQYVPEIRSFLLLAGPVNVHITVWLHQLEDLPAIESRLVTWLPSLGVTDRSVVYSTPKRMGFVLQNGRRTPSA